jgi:hypothetical protein
MPPRLLRAAAAAALTALTVPLAACGSDAAAPSGSAQVDEYRAEMTDACGVTAAALDALPAPTEGSMADFATEASALIADEAERLRVIEPPDDLDADHRAFVLNTDDQAASWAEVAATSATDSAALDRLVEEIGQLTLGRDELAGEMGIDACRRGG